MARRGNQRIWCSRGRTAWWVEPVFVTDVEYREISDDGLLRHPSFRWIRTDKTPNEIGLPAGCRC
ncbi:hypothetical protein [Nocardia sp. NPDC058114]|uniref:ATP dependent DNA ligase n=1 Tax=Nocardia sp. NPDC058114 TaxID=3346346 RepID=UPI0036D7CE3A